MAAPDEKIAAISALIFFGAIFPLISFAQEQHLGMWALSQSFPARPPAAWTWWETRSPAPTESV